MCEVIPKADEIKCETVKIINLDTDLEELLKARLLHVLLTSAPPPGGYL